MAEALTAIDLFCGCGGLTTGLKQAGFRVLGAVDNDELALDTYAVNHPEVHLWRGDVSLVTRASVKREIGIASGELDLLAGCPPCQGFSSLRTLNGSRHIRDSQNDLIFEFLRIVRELRPRCIMLENVPALSTDRRLTEFTTTLDLLGYSSSSAVLNAAAYGVPQRRRRFILLASKLGVVKFCRKSPGLRTVRDAIHQLPRPAKSDDALHKAVGHHTEDVRKLIARIPKDGGSRTDIGAKHLLECHKRTDGFYDVYGRMAWDEVSPTITTGCVNPSRGRFLHPRQNRAISLREAALLQTFPPNYFISLRDGKYAAARLIGNALPPTFVRRHATAVRRHLDKAKHRDSA